MDAAWLEDEVTRRLTLLPSENQLLQVVAPRPPDPPELSCISLPFGEVYRQLSASPPMGYAQLLAEELAAPKKVALALTMLIEAEAVQAKSRPANSEAQQLPQALSPDAQVDLDQTPPREGLSTILGRFRHRAHQHQASPNSGQETLHLMVFYDPPVWERLLRIVETIPQSSLPVERARLINQLQMRRSGTLRLVGPEEGETLVYLQPLRGEKKGSSLFLSFASAAIAWLEEPESISKLTDLVESFAETRHPFGIIAPHLESRLFTSLVQSEVLHIVREEPLDVGDLLRALPLD